MDLPYPSTKASSNSCAGDLSAATRYTRPSLIDRRLTLESRRSALAHRDHRTQRRLYDLGVFARVDAAIQDPDGDTDSKYVLYHLDEAQPLLDGHGRRRGTGTHRRMQDMPRRARGNHRLFAAGFVRYHAQQPLGTGAQLSLRTPRLHAGAAGAAQLLLAALREYDNLTVSFTALVRRSRDIRTFNSANARRDRRSFPKRFTKAITLFYRLTFRRVSVINDLKITPFLIPLLSQQVRVGIAIHQPGAGPPRRSGGSAQGRLQYDRSGARGACHRSRNETSSACSARNASYYPIGKKMVLARSTEVRRILSFHYVGRPTGCDSLWRNAFSVEAMSDRGFPENQAGPRDGLDRVSRWAESFLFFNQTELRFPLLGDNVGGVLFHDMGNIYSSVDHFSFRTHQDNLLDFDYMVHAVGFGIRYRTPVGPLRLDLAYSINPPYFFGFNGTQEELLNAGVNPCPAPSGTAYQCNVQNVSHFQFFFSIGQTF